MSTLRLPEEETLAIMKAVQIYIERMREPTSTTNAASFGLNDECQVRIRMHVLEAETFISAMRADLKIFAQANKLYEDRLQAEIVENQKKLELLLTKKNEIAEAQAIVATKFAELQNAMDS